MSQWKEAQGQELTFWRLQNYNLEECYKRKYAFFNDFLNTQNKLSPFTLDIGCGAIAYSEIMGFHNTIFCDSLMEEYLKLPDSKCNLKKYSNIQIFNYSIEDIKFKDNTFDLVFFLNVLDHVEHMEKAFNEVVRVANKHILFYCDLRDKTDACHQHEVSLNLIKEFEAINKLNIISSIIEDSSEPGMKAYLAIYKK